MLIITFNYVTTWNSFIIVPHILLYILWSRPCIYTLYTLRFRSRKWHYNNQIFWTPLLPSLSLAQTWMECLACSRESGNPIWRRQNLYYWNTLHCTGILFFKYSSLEVGVRSTGPASLKPRGCKDLAQGSNSGSMAVLGLALNTCMSHNMYWFHNAHKCKMNVKWI